MRLIGGDGPKLIDLLQMREKYLLQDRIELLGPVRHGDVRSVNISARLSVSIRLTRYRF